MKPPPSVKAWSVMVTPSTSTVEPSGMARGDAIEIGVGVGVGAGVDVGVEVGVAVGVPVGLGVALALGLGVAVGVAVGEAVALGLPLALALGLAVGTGEDALFCGSGVERIVKSLALASVSWPDPALPPGRRSKLLPAAGAGAAGGSCHVLA